MDKAISREELDPQPGDHVTATLWTDAHAFEVLRRTPKRATLRRLRATRTNRDADRFAPGGFFGHTSHPDGQRYTYESAAGGKEVTASLRKDGTWRITGYRFPLRAGAHEHYDYNY